jgi:hypothetical protein
MRIKILKIHSGCPYSVLIGIRRFFKLLGTIVQIEQIQICLILLSIKVACRSKKVESKKALKFLNSEVLLTFSLASHAN